MRSTVEAERKTKPYDRLRGGAADVMVAKITPLSLTTSTNLPKDALGLFGEEMEFRKK